MEYREHVAALKAELASLDVPCHLLRSLRITEIRCEQLMLQAQRLGAALEARTELRRLHVLVDDRFTAAVTGAERPDGPDDPDTEAQALLVVRDLQLAPAEASLALLEAEAEVLDSPEFATAFDAEEMGNDLPAALEAFVAANLERPQVSALLAARDQLL